jgi:hypothetical protein
MNHPVPGRKSVAKNHIGLSRKGRTVLQVVPLTGSTALAPNEGEAGSPEGAQRIPGRAVLAYIHRGKFQNHIFYESQLALRDQACPTNGSDRGFASLAQSNHIR